MANSTTNFLLRPEETLAYNRHAILLVGPLLIASFLILCLAISLCASKAWRPWRWRISSFELWKDFSFRLNRFRASRPAHFKPLSVDHRRINQVPKYIAADGVRELIAHLRDDDIEAIVEEARRSADKQRMGGDHYRMTVPKSEDGAAGTTPNAAYDAETVDNGDAAPAPANRQLHNVGMDAHDPVVQQCVGEVKAIFRKMRDVPHVLEVLGRLPNHRRAQRIVLNHPQILGGYFKAAEHEARGTHKHYKWIRMLAVLELLPPQMHVKMHWIEDSDVATLDGIKYVLDRLLGTDPEVAERTGRHGTQIRTLVGESLLALEKRGLMHGIRSTLRNLNPPREPRGDPRRWMKFLDRKSIGNRRLVWCHPESSLSHEEKKKLEIIIEIPDVELAPSLDEISNLETALKHRYAEAATEWLSESTTFMEIGLMIQRIIVVHHMTQSGKPRTGPSSMGECIESDRLTAAQIWNEMSQGKGSANVKDYGNCDHVSNILAYLDPEGIREECLSFRKLLDSEIITHYFQIFKARNKDKADPATYFVKAQYKSVEKPYAEATKTHRRGGVGAGRRPTRLIERLAERWEQNIYLEEEAHREHAAPSADIQIRNRFDPRKESKCDAYREPYAKSFALIVLPGTGTDEFYFYKVENRFEDAITPREVQPGVGGTGRGYQVTPVHPSGDIGPFIDLTDPSGLPSVHGESAWGPRTFDFFDENFRFQVKHKRTKASPLAYCLNTITGGRWVSQRHGRDGRIRGLRVKAKVAVQEAAVRVSSSADSTQVQRFHGKLAVSEQATAKGLHDNLYTLVCIITINVETEMSTTWYNMLAWSQGHTRSLFGLQRRVLDIRFCTRKYGPDGKAWGVCLGAGIGASHADEQEDIGMLQTDGGTVKQYDQSPDGLNRLDAFQRDEFRKELRTLCRLKIPETVGIPITIALFPDIYTNPDAPERAQKRATDKMHFWDEDVRPARGSVLARIEWDGPLVEREMADLTSEMILDERDSKMHGTTGVYADEVRSHPSNAALVNAKTKGARRRVGKEPWYYPSQVFSMFEEQLAWVARHIGFSDWESVEHEEESVAWAASLGFNQNFFRDCALEVRLDSTTHESADYVYRSRRSIVWGMRPARRVNSPNLRLEFLIGCPIKSLPGRMFEHLAEIAVASRWVEIMAVLFLTSVIFWIQNIGDAQMLEMREDEYCIEEKYELTQCWATNATYYYEVRADTALFINCTGATQNFERMVCFFPPSGQTFDPAQFISGIGISFSVFKAITIGLGFGLYRMFPSGRRGIETTVFLIFLSVFTCGSLMLVYGMLNGVIKISGEYAQSVMSTVLIMAIGVLIMVHAIKYFYKHNMVLWEIENFDFGGISDDNFATRRLRVPFAVKSYSMPGLSRDDEFLSANKPWRSKWYTERTLHPSSLPSSNHAVNDADFGTTGMGSGIRDGDHDFDDGSKYNC